MLRLEHVSKRFDAREVISDLSLEVPEGRIFGLLGPNGAGKTTMLRMVMGLILPTSGKIELFGGQKPGAAEVRARVGYMPQKLAMYPGLSAQENIRFFGGLYSVPKNEIEERAKELLRLVDLESRADDPVGHLSGGMARRAMLASALIHRPKLLILDEPTAGVDPLLRIKFWDWFEKLREAGTSIIITTHHISEAERSGDVVFLRQGQLIARGSPSELLTKYGAKDLEEAFVSATEVPRTDA